MLIKEDYDYRTDYWSLGICLFEFICGYVPFGDQCDNNMDIYKSIINCKLDFPSFIDDAYFKDLIKKLLTKDPEKRLSSVKSILSHPWFNNCFNYNKLMNMEYNPPYIPKENKIIKLKSLEYKEFINKKAYSGDYVPLDESKFNDDDLLFKEFESV